MSKAPKPAGPAYPAKNLPDTDSSARPPTSAAKTTIADVARQAQVSPMTVSRVINDPDSVAEPRRMAVQQAIEALRYSPNPAAKALAGRKPVQNCALSASPAPGNSSSARLTMASQRTRFRSRS